MPGDPLDRYEFAILNALVDDAGAVDGIFEEPIATIRHVQRLAQTSAEPDAERYRKWAKGLIAAQRRRPVAPAPVVILAKEARTAAKATLSAADSTSPAHVQPNELNLNGLLAKMNAAMSAQMSAPAQALAPGPDYNKIAAVVKASWPAKEQAPAPTPAPVEEDEDGPIDDDLTLEEAQAHIMTALAEEGYMPSDIDLTAVERAADEDPDVVSDPLGAYNRAVGRWQMIAAICAIGGAFIVLPFIIAVIVWNFAVAALFVPFAVA